MAAKASLKYNILLVDDYAPVRRALRKIIEANPDFHVIGEVNNGRELLRSLKRVPANLVILDITMPGMTGFEAARRLKQDYPEVKILVLTIHSYKEYADRALSLGAEGYLLKEEADEELVPAITCLKQGRTYISSRISA